MQIMGSKPVSSQSIHTRCGNPYLQTALSHNRWLIYTLSGSIYPVHGWSIAMNPNSVEQQRDVSSERVGTDGVRMDDPHWQNDGGKQRAKRVFRPSRHFIMKVKDKTKHVSADSDREARLEEPSNNGRRSEAFHVALYGSCFTFGAPMITGDHGWQKAGSNASSRTSARACISNCSQGDVMERRCQNTNRSFD